MKPTNEMTITELTTELDNLRSQAGSAPAEGDGETAVLVTTSKRGVFFGTAASETPEGEMFRLRGARMALYWPSKGVLNLAEEGPFEGCRVSAPTTGVTLIPVADITSVTVATAKALQAWQAATTYKSS